jgi:CBS domain-containing protein
VPVGVSVAEVMRKAVVTVGKNETLDKIAKIMEHAGIGSVIIVDKGRIVGVLTEGDIIRALAKGKDYKKTKALEIMSRPVRTVAPDTDIEEATKIMRDLDITRLLVVRKNKLVGIITERDMVKIEPALIELMVEKGSIEKVGTEHKGIGISGHCENCKNYSDNLRFVEFRYLCEDCRRL